MKNIQAAIHTQIKKVAKLVSYSVVSLLYLGMTMSPAVHAAAPATLTLSPGTVNVTNGSSFSVTINVNAGTNKITGAQACITYDSSKLTLTNTNTSASALTYATPGSSADCSAGQAQVSRFDVTQPSGTFTLAVLTFDAKMGGTTASLAFDNAKSYIKDNETTDLNGNYVSILSGSTGTTATLNAPAPPPPSPEPQSPAPTNTSPSGQATPKPDTTKKQPSITDTKNTTTPATPTSTPAQAASEDTKTAPVADATNDTAKTVTKKSGSKKVTYIISGAIIVALIAAGLMIKFIGAPGLPNFGTHKTQVDPVDAPSESSPTSSTLSSIPDPELPTPSSVVKPTEPPSSSGNDGDQKPV